VLDKAVEAAGYKRMAPILTRDSLLRNFDIAEKLGCLGARRKSFSKGKIPDSRFQIHSFLTVISDSGD